MYRSMSLWAPCHAYAQIYVFTCSVSCLCAQIYIFILRSMCLCLDLCLFGPCVMPMFRCMCLCTLCHVCMLRSICWLLMSCAFITLLFLDISLSCVLTLIGGVQIQIPWSRPTSTHLELYQRIWIISLCASVCLLASMLYLYAFLSRSRLCHALCIPWACFCVVTSIPLMAYWGVTTCETHPCDAGLLNAYHFSTTCVLALIGGVQIQIPWSRPTSTHL